MVSLLVVTDARASVPSENVASASSLCSAAPSPASQSNAHGGSVRLPAGLPSTKNATRTTVAPVGAVTSIWALDGPTADACRRGEENWTPESAAARGVAIRRNARNGLISLQPPREDAPRLENDE